MKPIVYCFVTVLFLAAWAAPTQAQTQLDPQAQLQRLLETGYSLDTILVGFSPQISAESERAVAAAVGIAKIRDFERIDAGLYQVPHDQVLETLERLSQRSEVAFAEPNYLRRTLATPNDPRYGEQWGFQRIDAESAWDITQGNNVIVAVIDTGVDQDHPELADQRWINTDEIAGNQIDDDNNGYVDDHYGYDFFGTATFFGLLPPPEGDEDSNPEDDNGHGSHTAGTIAAATNNGIGVAGTASASRVMVLRALGGLLGFGYSSDIIDAMIYAVDNGAHVVSMSLGSTAFSNAELAVVSYAEDNNVLFVAAAGNGGNATMNYPAGYPDVMAISATTSSDTLASFSTRGANIDVGAPGQKVLSTWKGGGYNKIDGTSMACPHAAGVCALVRSQFPNLNAGQVRQMVRDGAQDLGASGWDPNFGDGRLSAFGALTATPADPGDVLLFCPGNGGTLNSGNTPFGFAWSTAQGAASYALQLELPNGGTKTLKGIQDNYFYPSQASWNNAAPGSYRWRVAALDAGGQVLSTSGWWDFSI